VQFPQHHLPRTLNTDSYWFSAPLGNLRNLTRSPLYLPYLVSLSCSTKKLFFTFTYPPPLLPSYQTFLSFLPPLPYPTSHYPPPVISLLYAPPITTTIIPTSKAERNHPLTHQTASYPRQGRVSGLASLKLANEAGRYRRERTTRSSDVRQDPTDRIV